MKTKLVFYSVSFVPIKPKTEAEINKILSLYFVIASVHPLKPRSNFGIGAEICFSETKINFFSFFFYLKINPDAENNLKVSIVWKKFWF